MAWVRRLRPGRCLPAAGVGWPGGRVNIGLPVRNKSYSDKETECKGLICPGSHV